MTVSPSPSSTAASSVASSPAREAAVAGAPAMDFVAALLGHRRELAAYAQLLSHERNAAEDLVQDTLERALRAQKSFRTGTNLHAWLARIMRNLFTDRCRRNALSRSVDAMVVLPDVATEPQPVSYLDLLSMADVDAALGEIGPEHREVFMLAYVERLSYGAIAERLRIPLSTVGTRLWRAKAKLRRALKKRSGRGAFPAAAAANDVGVGRGRQPARRPQGR